MDAGCAAVEELAGLARRLAAVAEADPEREVCGFVVRWGDGRREVIALPNVVERDVGGGLPASARHAFVVDPAGHLALSRRLRADGGAIEGVFHSHVEGPARMSAHDRRLATEDGRPVMPGTWQVIVGLLGGKVSEIRLFSWRGAGWDDEGIPLPVPVPPG